MAFQPFGYRVEITSPLTVAEVKESIWLRERNRFDPRHGPAGLLLGRLVILWLPLWGTSPWPSTIAWISEGPTGSRILGRAIVGPSVRIILGLFGVILSFDELFKIISGNFSDDGFGSIVFMVILIIAVLAFLGGSDRDAEPLVRYLENTGTGRWAEMRAKLPSDALPANLRLSISGKDIGKRVTPCLIFDSLIHLQESAQDSVVLFIGAQSSIQTIFEDDQFRLQRRQAGDSHYLQGVRLAERTASAPGSAYGFSFEETLSTFMAYAAGLDMHGDVAWQPADGWRTR